MPSSTKSQFVDLGDEGGELLLKGEWRHQYFQRAVFFRVNVGLSYDALSIVYKRLVIIRLCIPKDIIGKDFSSIRNKPNKIASIDCSAIYLPVSVCFTHCCTASCEKNISVGEKVLCIDFRGRFEIII